MIILEVDQGSEQWHKARAGVITASKFGDARARLKSGKNAGDYTAAAKDYAFRVAVERISGEPLDEGFETWQMKRGHELEPQARMEHEAVTGKFVDRAGFILTDDRVFGASADGLIDVDGGCEYKCFIAPEKLRSIIIDDNTDDVIDQVMGCMWITGRTWWDFCLYCPALESTGNQLKVIHMVRDDDYINALEADLLEFSKLVDHYEAKLRAGSIAA
jgi:hypothetical protein